MLGQESLGFRRGFLKLCFLFQIGEALLVPVDHERPQVVHVIISLLVMLLIVGQDIFLGLIRHFHFIELRLELL